MAVQQTRDLVVQRLKRELGGRASGRDVDRLESGCIIRTERTCMCVCVCVCEREMTRSELCKYLTSCVRFIIL